MRRAPALAAPLPLLLLLCCAAAAVAATRATPSSGSCTLRSGANAADRKQRHAKECSALVHKYMELRTADLDAPHPPDKLVFFLHIPRTAGKTYANCFLRTALPPSKRCAKSYDVVRLNVSSPDCLALISHDDFSISQWFPPGATTITQLRKPVDRLISSYEFAVDVAAKGVPVTKPLKKNKNRRADFVGTLEVWPWSVLVPWFKEDMRMRMDRLKEAAREDPTAWRDYKSPQNRTYYWNEAKNESVWVLPDPEAVLDPYNNSLVMPLHEFIEHPIAEELIHNGQTLQVLGLTNYSYWPEAPDLRHCVRSSWVAREMLLALATKRLKAMGHVGLSERLDDSVISMAADLGLNFSGPAYKYTSAAAFSYDDGAADPEQPITFNATTQGGVNVTLTRDAAEKRLVEIYEEQKVLKKELELMIPRLSELVEKEAAWLDEQDKLKQGDAAADGSESATAEQQEGSSSAPADGQQADVAAGEAAAAAADATGSSRKLAEVDGEAWRVDDGEAAVLEAAQAEADAEAGSDAEGSGVADEGGEDPFDAEAQPAEEGAAQAAAEGEAAAAAAEGEEPPPPEPEEEELLDHIDSPWAQDIESLDQSVAAKQEQLRQLEAEQASLQHSELVVGADLATGRARQLLPDESFVLPGEDLGIAYRRCADAGKGRHEKRKPYKYLRTPWGESFVFRPEARARISPQTRERIHQLNALDEELWKAGLEILEHKLAEQRAAGALQDYPQGRPLSPAIQPPPTKRRMRSNDDFYHRRDPWEWTRSSFSSVNGGPTAEQLYHPPPPPSYADTPPPPAEGEEQQQQEQQAVCSQEEPAKGPAEQEAGLAEGEEGGLAEGEESGWEEPQPEEVEGEEEGLAEGEAELELAETLDGSREEL